MYNIIQILMSSNVQIHLCQKSSDLYLLQICSIFKRRSSPVLKYFIRNQVGRERGTRDVLPLSNLSIKLPLNYVPVKCLLCLLNVSFTSRRDVPKFKPFVIYHNKDYVYTYAYGWLGNRWAANVICSSLRQCLEFDQANWSCSA